MTTVEHIDKCVNQAKGQSKQKYATFNNQFAIAFKCTSEDFIHHTIIFYSNALRN